MTQKVVISEVLWIDRRLDSEDKTDIVIEGNNTKGSRVSVRIENLSSFMLAYIADEASMALMQVMAKVKKNIEMVRQTIND